MILSTIDFETCLIQPGKQAPRPVCLVTDVDGRDELLHCVFDRDNVRDHLYRAFTGGYVVGAYTAFDAAVAMADMPELAEFIWLAYDQLRVLDVQVNEKLIDLARGRLGGRPGPNGWEKVFYSLADIVARRFGRVMDKDTWRLRYGTLLGTPCAEWEPGARDYPLGDLRETRAVLQAQLQEPPECLVDAARQARASFWLTLVTARGFALDRQQIERLDADLKGEYRRIIDGHDEPVSPPIPGHGQEMRHVPGLAQLGLVKQERDGSWTRDTKAAGARLVAVWPASAGPAPHTDDGGVELTKQACKESHDPALKAYSRLSEIITTQAKLESLKAAAVVGMPIQSRFEVLQETGRTSCSGGRITKKTDIANRMAYSFQLQNITKAPGLRECFIPRPGYLLWSIDYGQLELCTWAQVCYDLFGFSRLGEMLNAKVDVHSMMGAKIFGLEYDWVLANKKKDEKAKKARASGKPLVFGKPGMMGPKGIQAFAKAPPYEIDMTLEQATEYGNQWSDLFPESKPYFKYVRHCVDEGYAVQLRSGRIRGGVGPTDCANGFFQALAADAAKHALYEVMRACYTGRDSSGNRYPALHGSYVLDFVHDEGVGESPIDRASEAVDEASGIMRRIAREWLPNVPPEAEGCLMERWYKDASIERGEDGRIKAWRPKETR